MTPRFRALSAALVVLIGVLTAGFVALPAEAATVADLRISEVDTDPSDWVELVNTGSGEVDAGGLVLEDQGGGRFTIPASTLVPEGGVVVFAALGYGLSGNDGVKLLDGTTIVDEWSWSGGHAVHTFAWCDGILQESTASTSGSANACPDLGAALVVNEADSDPNPDDFIELANVGTQPLFVGGLIVADSDPRTVAIPAGTRIAAGGYAAFSTETVFGFGLSGNDSARLLHADGSTVIDAQSWSGGHAAFSFGLCPDATGTWGPTAAVTRGAANDCGSGAPDFSTIAINEVNPNGTDWVELVNIGSSTVDVSGLLLKDSGESNTITIPASSTIAPGAFLAIDVTGLGGSADSARLFDGATLIDSATWSSPIDATWGRCPDGTGAFVDTDGPTKAAANDCPEPAGWQDVVINEIESSGGDPADWVELFNTGSSSVDISGWYVKDSEDSRTFRIPGGTTLPAGGYYVAIVDVPGGFGLGNNDRARVFLADGATLVDEVIWGPDHSPTTFGLCPDGTGSFVQTFLPTKGGPNDCSPIRINEVDSSGATPVDWIELFNAGSAPVDISGYVLRDSSASDVVIPAATTLAAGGFLAIDVDVDGGFGLGGSDSARLFAADGTSLLDSTNWTEHAATSWGRCPDGTGAFAVTAEVTKGAANVCVGLLAPEAWPGGTAVSTVDAESTFDGDLSGLAYEPSATPGTRGTLWGVVNGGGILHKLAWNGTLWQPSPGAWSDGTVLRYADGTGIVDAEGVTFGGASPASGIYVASERDDSDGTSGVSRPSVLRYDIPSTPGATVSATQEWNLTGIIPPVGNNTGLEGIAWIPDAFLVAKGFVDHAAGELYDPVDYPTHGAGLFFVGVEATGEVYALALGTDGSKVLVATIDPKLSIVADVTFDVATGTLWAACDEACDGRTVTLEIAQSGAADGDFVATHVYENPAGMADSIANEGIAFGSSDLCATGARPVWYADDADSDGFSLREGTLATVCDATGAPGSGHPGVTPPSPTESQLTSATQDGIGGPGSTAPGGTLTIDIGAEHAGEQVDVWVFSTPVHLGTFVVPASGLLTVTIPASLSAGSHRLAVFDSSGAIIGWYTLVVRGGGLASTGGAASWGLLPVAMGALLLGVGAVAAVGIRRRQAGVQIPS